MRYNVSSKKLSPLTLVLMGKGMAVPREYRLKQREQAAQRRIG